EHGINHMGSAKNMIFTVATQKKQTHNLESHPYSIAEGNWIKNQEKYTNLTPKYAVSILSQNNGEKKLSFVDNRNQSVIVIDNAAITQKVISDLYAKELENRTDLSKGLTNTQIDEKQALHYRNYETEARKLGIAITSHTGLEFNPTQVMAIEFAEDYINSRRSGMNGNKEIKDYYQQLDKTGKDIFLDSFKNHISANHKENGVISKALLEAKIQSFEKFISSNAEISSQTLKIQNNEKLDEKFSKISDLYLGQIDNGKNTVFDVLDDASRLYNSLSKDEKKEYINSLETLLHYDFSDNKASIDEIESFLIKAEDDLTYGSEKEVFKSNLEQIGENIDSQKFFIIDDLQITPEQRDPENEWEDPELLTDEQLSKIPDVLHGFELMYNHKRDLALGVLEFRRNGVFFSIEPDRRILMTYLDEETSTHEKYLTVNDVKFINQKIETVQNKEALDKIPNEPDLFENIPEELTTVYEKWQQKIENGLDYKDCANFQKDCEALGYTFNYGLDAVPFDLRPIDIKEQNINNQNSKIMTTQNKDFDQVKYLKDQLKYLQFGEGEKLHKDLEAGINSSEKEFQIKTSSDKTLPGNTIDFTLNYNKSEKGGIFLNSYLAELKNKKGEELSHIFNISKENTFDAKEAINLLEGRSVKIEFINPKIEEKQTAFVKLDFNEPKTEYGTYKFQSFHENYGVNTAEIVDKSGLIFDKPEWKDDTIKSLERGNIVNVKFKHEDKEIEGKAFLNPQYKTLNLYDSNMTRINTNKPLEGMGNDNAHDKSNVREQNRSRGI
ncbi:hypothetical protein, partial [Elizabethkingia anophelis]|uniref:hypothetical protein n=1 Tax=Elizabethkingia anophelis TaxID=1117645 RepID=UPI003462FD07